MLHDNEFDYYLIGNDNSGDVPRLVNDDEFEADSTGFLFRYRPVSPGYTAHIAFGPPIPKKPRLSDAMSLHGSCSVFSKTIHDALSQHTVKGLQLVPTLIRGQKDEAFDHYWIANIYQKMAFFNEEETEYEYMSKVTGAWEEIEKIILDKEKLASVPLEDRLVFVSEENCEFILYHQSVVDIIMSANPEGVIFTPVEEWEA